MSEKISSTDVEKCLSHSAQSALRIVLKCPTQRAYWKKVLKELKTLPIEITREYWITYFKTFPTDSTCLCEYLTEELKAQQYEHVFLFFDKSNRGLALQCPHMKVWQIFLDAVDESSLKSSQEMHEAYILAKNIIGQQNDSEIFWDRYLLFLQNKVHPRHQIGVLRNAYHEALLTPYSGVEFLMEKYEAFERAHNSRAVVANDLKQAHKRSVFVSKELIQRIYYGVDRSHIALPLGEASSTEDTSQYLFWRRVIAYELTNPLSFKEHDANLVRRIENAYRSALMHCRCHAELWVELANFLIINELKDEAKSIFEEAIESMPQSIIVCCSFADSLCSNLKLVDNSIEKGHKVFQNLISQTLASPVFDVLDNVAQAYSCYMRWARFAHPFSGIEKARHIFREAIREEPRLRRFLVPFAAEIELSSGNPKEKLPLALEYYNAVSFEDQKSLGLLESLSALHARAGSYTEAISLLRQAPGTEVNKKRIALLEQENTFKYYPVHNTLREYEFFLSEEGLSAISEQPPVTYPLFSSLMTTSHTTENLLEKALVPHTHQRMVESDVFDKNLNCTFQLGQESFQENGSTDIGSATEWPVTSDTISLTTRKPMSSHTHDETNVDSFSQDSLQVGRKRFSRKEPLNPASSGNFLITSLRRHLLVSYTPILQEEYRMPPINRAFIIRKTDTSPYKSSFPKLPCVYQYFVPLKPRKSVLKETDLHVKELPQAILSLMKALPSPVGCVGVIPSMKDRIPSAEYLTDALSSIPAENLSLLPTTVNNERNDDDNG